MAKKDYFINSVHLIEVQGSTNVPTLLLYQQGTRDPALGSEALHRSRSRSEINEDFKVDLGNFKPGATSNRQFHCGDGGRRSAAELTGDFFNGILQEARAYLKEKGLTTGIGILVAEPLSMHDGLVSDNWLSSYRTAIRRLLVGKGFDKIDFMPEPFAVYQFYRHGERHPILAEQRKHYALVLDFGGGTFDVCVIETTKWGDVSFKGHQMAKPLSASSKAVGGYFTNRVIAEHLIRKLPLNQGGGTKVNKALQEYARWRKDGVDILSLSLEFRNFIDNFQRLTYRIEDVKLALSRSIRNWSLDATDVVKISVSVPSDPFAIASPPAQMQFTSSDFRELFIHKLWNPELKTTVRLALDRARQESSGAAISVVLLSGGSANIRWLAELLKREFAAELSSAEILSIKDYQEVVSKGIALECARRFYTDEGLGDFSAVTYNRLCLILNPDGKGLELKRFTPRDPGIPKDDTPGVLLPSATFVKGFEDKPMRWKVRLDSAPKRQLTYYFTKSSFDPDATKELHNIEETSVRTPRNVPFGSQISVELTISNDGTSTPQFVYYSGSTKEEAISVTGRPFYLDMTSTESTGVSRAYIGLDFGTSNSSISYVSHEQIQIYERRSQEEAWADLSDLASRLPYPLAAPLAIYRKETDGAKLATAAREFIEAALTLAAYTAYLDFCSLPRRGETRYFKGFTLGRRSAGPLWGFLRDMRSRLGDKATFASDFNTLFEPAFYPELNEAISIIAQQKHGKVDDTAAHALRPVQIIANCCYSVFSKSSFGMFQGVRKKRFDLSYQGIYRHAHGRPPFIRVSRYEGTIPFSDQETVLFNHGKGLGVSLEPLILWHHCAKHSDLEDGHCFLFDSAEKDGSFSYKAVGFTCTLNVSKEVPEMTGLHGQIAKFVMSDPQLFHFDLSLTDERSDGW